MISKHDDIPCTIIPQSNTRCSIISAITLSEDDFMSRRPTSRGDYDDDDDDDDDEDDVIEEIEASIEQMVMDMYKRKSAALSTLSGMVSASTESDETSQHDRFGSSTGPRTSELLQAMPKPERKPSVNILLSSLTSSQGSHDIQFHRDSLPHHHAHETFDRIPNLPSRRPSESISRMQSHVSEQTERSTLVGLQSSSSF